MTRVQHAHVFFSSSTGGGAGEASPGPSGETTALRGAAGEDEGPAPPPEDADFPPEKAAAGAAGVGGFGFAVDAGWGLSPPNSRPPSWEASADAGGSLPGSGAVTEDDLGSRRRVIARGKGAGIDENDGIDFPPFSFVFTDFTWTILFTLSLAEEQRMMLNASDQYYVMLESQLRAHG